MFAPEGYFSWEEICEHTRYWSDILIAAECFRAHGKPIEGVFDEYPRGYLLHTDMVKAGLAETLDEAFFVSDLHTTWILANFLKSYPIYICSPQGDVLKAGEHIYLHADRLDWCSWSWPASKRTEFQKFFENFRVSPQTMQRASERFPCIDTGTGCLTLKNNTVSLLRSALHFFGSDNYESRIFENGIKPFVGWAVCMREEELPENLYEIFRDVGVFDEALWGPQVEATETSPAAMPDKRSGAEYVVSCVFEAFPDGKGDATWNEVETATGYSRRHITRALNSTGNYSQWKDEGK